MTDEQINRVIAESLEPEPATLSLQTLKYWWWEPGGNGPDEDKIWPKDFLHDPAMRDKLQEKLLEEGWVITLVPTSDGIYATFCRYKDRQEQYFKIESTRERIWALAYIRAHGLKGIEVDHVEW